MNLLIDGYNVIFAAGWMGRGNPASALRRARQRLLEFLVAAYPSEQLLQTTVVYDSARIPLGPDDETSDTPCRVRFAHGFEDADELIEQLIARESVPKRLLVVSSDHRLQQAARRRRASYADSEQWITQTELLIARRRRPETTDSAKTVTVTGDVDYWLDIFMRHPPDQPPAELPHDEIFPPGYAEDDSEL